MELFYRQYGEQGEAVIILHGMLGMSDNWVHFARKLADEGYRVFLPDARNHGNSPHESEMNYRLMARDIYEFTEQHGLREAIVAGHSMGGKTAMQYAADYPGRVSKLIVLDIAPRAYGSDEDTGSKRINHPQLLKILSEINLKQFGTRQQITDYFEAVPQAAQIKFFLQKNIKLSHDGGYEFKFNPNYLYENIEALSGKPVFGKKPYTSPVLFVKGEHSDYITESDYSEIKNYYPAVKTEILSDAGHILHSDNPKALLQLFLLFLKQ